MMNKIVFTLLGSLLLCGQGMAAEWGTIKGSVLLDGDVPKPVLLFAKGAPIKDAAVCAAANTPDQSVVINPETKGIANVFIYMRKAPKDVYKDEKPLPAQVVFDQKNCIFKPHAMIVRAGQTVEVLNSDPIAHNTHTNTLKNTQQNILIAPDTPKGKGQAIPLPLGESLPSKVVCDFHTHMVAYWLILDHPYMAVTDAKGNFTIKNLPVGKHEFRIWQERAGYLDRKYIVDVVAGENPALKPVMVKMDQLEDK